MSKKAIVWIRDDFRLNNNHALSYATNNYDFVSVIYIYNKEYFENVREAQRWWISKSLINFKEDLGKYNINLELIISDEISFFLKMKKDDNISVYWNKVYEPHQLKIDKKILEIFEKKSIISKSFKGNVLNEYHKVNKEDGTPYKVYSPFWRVGERIYLEDPFIDG